MATSRLKYFPLQLLPALLFVAAWEVLVRINPQLVFFFGSPSKVVGHLTRTLADGSLLRDATTTFLEAISGFIIGNVVGIAMGISLWYSKMAFTIAKPYVIVLGAAPLFALSPVLVVWFGIGFLSKVMIVTLSTVFIALLQAYTGASEVDRRYSLLLKSFGASKSQIFRKAVLPAALVWVFSGLRLNIGFALLGAFIGEFISSTAGIAHSILVASGLFDMSLVLLGVFLFMLMALSLNLALSAVEPFLKRSVARWL